MTKTFNMANLSLEADAEVSVRAHNQQHSGAEGVSVVPAISARQSVFPPSAVNGPDPGPGPIPKAPEPPPGARRTRPNMIPGSQRCDHCGQPGTAADMLQGWEWPGRPDGVRLHLRCEAPWKEKMTTQRVHSGAPVVAPTCSPSSDLAPPEVPTAADNILGEAIAAASYNRASDRLKPLTLSELFELEIKQREMILSPILSEKGTAMIYAYRGVGKTHVALGIAYAAASGGTFLKWSAPKPRRVLLIDGEMPAVDLKDRLLGIVAIAEKEAAPDAMRVIAGDLIEHGGIGNLADPTVQAELDKHLDGIDLLILDNLSSLTAVIRDNDQESWTTIQQWLLRLRRRGISVLLVHHAGKGGEQRGTSRREDILDTSISLRRPSDYVSSEGARFEVHFEKARGVTGDAAGPFEAKLTADPGGRPLWIIREIVDVQKAQVEGLLADGLSIRDIAEETGIPKSTVHRIKKAMEAAGNVH
jgi:AAA domain/Homeodomain-like domain